jgi:hypothetical protein
MKDLSDATRIILNCPTCGRRGPHKHRISGVGEMFGHGKDCHYVECEACHQETMFTKQVFDGISDKIDRA